MSRRKNRKRNRANPSLTFRDVSNRRADEEIYLYEPSFCGRPRHKVIELGFSLIPPFPFNPELFAKDLNEYGPSTSVIADSNIFLAETDWRIWDALFKNKQLTIVGPVAEEIEPWLRDPRGTNVDAHKVIRDAKLLKNDIVSKFSIPEEQSDLVFAVEWYTNLLGLRKDLRAGIREGQFDQTGTIPNNADLNEFIRRNFGERSQRLAISGDRAKVAAHQYHDEAIVVLGILYALVSKQQTILITRDENVLEQFRKACWLIDTHYRALRLAEIYALNPLAFMPVKRINVGAVEDQARLPNAFMDDELILLTKPSDHLRELLPKERMQIAIHCCLIKDFIEIWSFGLIDSLGKVFRMKAKTSGRNTDRFGEKNCHITVGPLTHDIGDWAVVGHDRTVEKDKFRFSMIDANLVLSDGEGFTRLMPTSIVLP